MADQVLIQTLEGALGPMSSKELAESSGLRPDDVVAALNVLLKAQRVAVTRSPTDRVQKFRLVDEESANRIRNLTPEQKQCYLLIMDSADFGITTKDLQKKTSFPLQHVKNICMKLKEKQMVKDVKPVHSKRQAVWLGWNVVPNKDIAGGLFYVNGELQEAQIQQLMERTKRMLSARPDRSWTVEEISRLINFMETDKVQAVLTALKYDRVVDASSSIDMGNEMEDGSMTPSMFVQNGSMTPGMPGGQFEYGGATPSSFANPSRGGVVTRYRIRERHALYGANIDLLRDLPCVRCRVRGQCDSSTRFSNSTPNPTNCTYFNRWLYLKTEEWEEVEVDAMEEGEADGEVEEAAEEVDMEDVLR